MYCLATEPQLFERDGYDYVHLRSRRALEPKTPNSFGGVSGSGLWRFSLARLSESEIKPFDFQLAGVAFYELPGRRRWHGHRSVSRAAFYLRTVAPEGAKAAWVTQTGRSA